MKFSSKLFRHTFHSLTYIVVSLLVLAAIMLSIARLTLPVIEDYKDDIEIWVSDLIGQQVEIATLDAAWYGLEPQLVLKGVQLLSKDRSETFGYLQQARIGLNIVGSVYEGRFQPGALTIEGAHLVIIRQADGNVSISGLDRGAGNKTQNKDEALSDWLFNQRILDIKDSEIIWLDLKSKRKKRNATAGEDEDVLWKFSQVNLRFRNDGDHHLIHGAVTLPDALGARLEVAMDARGDLLSANGWSGSAYVEGSNLKFRQWLDKMPKLQASINDGVIGLRLWSQWRKASLTSVKGDVFSNGFQLSVENEPKIQVIESLSSNVLIQKINEGWEATFDDISISTTKKIWPEARVDLKADLEKGIVDAQVSAIDIADVLPIIKLFDRKKSKTFQLLSRLKPSGVINDIHVSVADMKTAPQYYVSGKINDFSNLPWRKIPGVKDVNGQFSLGNGVFQLDIPRQNINLNYSGVFSYPARLNDVEGVILGKNDNNGFSLVAKNIHAEYRGAIANGSLRFDVPIGKDPYLDLAFYFKNGKVQNAKYYIPSKIMNSKAVDWITKSLIKGKVKSGGLLYFGNVKKFPFYQSQGLFDLSLDIEDGTLLFAKDWPRITGIDGVFELSANSLSFYADSAWSMESRLSRVNVVFPEFRATDRKLLIDGIVEGSSENKLRYLHKSPLETLFASAISPLKIFGDSSLNLSLDIPLGDVKKTKVDGLVKIANNRLLADEWKLNMENVSTNLRFDNKGIYTDAISASMAGMALTGEINTRDGLDSSRNIIISGAADVEIKEINYLLDEFVDKAHWGDYLAGKTQIQTKVNIPVLSKKDDAENISLEIEADLENISLSLPFPLGKEVTSPDKLKLKVDLSGEQRLLDIKTNDIHALFEMIPVGETQLIRRGGIGFGETAKLPTEHGFRFLGHLDRFSWTQWEPVIFPSEGEIPLLSGGGAGSSQYFNVEVDRLELFGSWFGKTSVQASSGAQLWSIHLSGDEIAGEVFIPVVLSSGPLVMNMDKLVISRPESDEGEEEIYLDPKKMPEVKITAKDFIFNEINFGALSVVANKIDTGLHLDKFSMKTKYTDISATGNWVEGNGDQVSAFDIQVKTTKLDKSIASWGFSDAFGDGKGKVEINASWPGKPSDFSFEKASGNMNINIKDASLLNFELGAAKMVGLFLPRRLLLDFRDVFKKGMLFDSIKGHYKIDDGNAYTTDLNLDGPMADILMTGRIGLVAEDYDQLVTVNRRLVGDSISTLAALAANPLVNPILAAQVYALKKLFEKQIDDILSVQYTVTGSWEEPKITPVVKNLETRGEQIDELFE